MSITFTQAAVAAFALIGATATATWNIRNDRLEELTLMVESYHKSKSWKIPEVIAKLDKSVEYLNSELGLIAENQKKQKDNEKLKEQISELSKTVSMQKNQLSEFKLDILEKDKFIKSLFSDTKEVVLAKNRSAKFFGSEIVVALNDATSMSGYADITINNNKHQIEVGSIIPIVTKSNDCKLIFNEFVEYSVVNLSLLCKKI